MASLQSNSTFSSHTKCLQARTKNVFLAYTGYVVIRWTRPRPKKHQALAIDAYPCIAYFCSARQIWYTLPIGERWVNPLPDEASRAKWEPEKKDPLRGSFFSYRPSAGAAPRSVLTQQKCCFARKTFAQKSNNL